MTVAAQPKARRMAADPDLLAESIDRPSDTGRSNVAEFSVTELSRAIKGTLEDRFGYVRLRGEISGFRGRHGSGHAYFALKDEDAKIEAVIWRGVFDRLKFKPEEGLEVIATGKITTYPGSSKYQIVIDALEPAGAGALMVLLEERRKRLEAEGLFAEARKQLLPFLPKVVGIITSPTGAVIRDMLHGFEERFPTRVIVWPVRVQGDTCGAEVAAAVHGFNALDGSGSIPRPDVLIVARGGGSLEDLWGFNDEALVRAIAASDIPVISAVGHETDWTLCDLVADARAPTPTKAAEWAVPKWSELVERLQDFDIRLRRALLRGLDERRSHLRAAARGLPKPADLLALPRQRFDGAAGRLGFALQNAVQIKRGSLDRLAGRHQIRLLSQRLTQGQERLIRCDQRLHQGLAYRLEVKRGTFSRLAGRLNVGQLAVSLRHAGERLSVRAARLDAAQIANLDRRRRSLDMAGSLLKSLSYQSVLARGFVVVRGPGDQTLRRAADVPQGAALSLEFADGRVAAKASGLGGSGEARQGSLFE